MFVYINFYIVNLVFEICLSELVAKIFSCVIFQGNSWIFIISTYYSTYHCEVIFKKKEIIICNK